MNETLESVRSSKTVLLRTYKRDCTPVSTPVSIVFDGDCAFFRSYARASKTRRLQNNPSVEVAPGTLSGRVTGPMIVTARQAPRDGEADIAAKAFAREHRILQGPSSLFTHCPMGYRTLHYELTVHNGRAE